MGQQKVRIHCDNLPVVELLNSGRARDEAIAMWARLLSTIYNIGIKVTHIAGTENNVERYKARLLQITTI